MSTAYHPQTNGQTERVNQILEQYLRCYVNYQQSDWSQLLIPAEFAYNNIIHEGTKETPFFLEYGRHPNAGPTLDKRPSKKGLEEIGWQRSQAQEKAKAALLVAQKRAKWYFDKKKKEIPFSVGDQVMVNLRDYQTIQRSLTPRWEGPFKIKEKIGEVSFSIER